MTTIDPAASAAPDRSPPISRPVVIGHHATGAPIWLTPFGAVLHDLPIPFLDADGNEVFE